MKSQVIKIGIVGGGRNTQEKHIPYLKNLPDVAIVSIANRTRDSATRVAKQFSIPNIYDRWQDLVAAEDTDAIVIGTWPNMHCLVTEAALKAGKHVLCEARMAMDLQEANRMLHIAQSHSHLIAQLVPAPMTLHVDKFIQKMVQEEAFGKILVVQVLWQQSAFMDETSPLHWRQDKEKSGLNAMALGIFYEILLRWVGPAQKVAALGKVFVPERKDPETGKMVPIAIPDHLEVLAEMECGAMAHIQQSSVIGLASAPTIWIYGSQGTLKYDVMKEKAYWGHCDDKKLKEMTIPPEYQGKWRVEEEFVNAIRGQEVVRLTTFDDGVQYMKFTEAVHRSWTTGQSVSLADL